LLWLTSSYGFKHLNESELKLFPFYLHILTSVSDLADVHDGRDEVEPSIILLERGLAELLPKEHCVKMERTLPTRAGVEGGGMTCDFTVG
jgi:hypothetical protein